MSNTAVVIIPARYHSTRLPGKPLLKIADKPMIQWVYERACQINGVEQVLVGTDHSKIRETVEAFGGKVVMTPENCRNGSERVGLIARDLDCDIVVNLQGDEPLISVAAVTKAIEALRAEPELNVATLAYPIATEAEWRNPSIVKVLRDRHGNALYFSRAAIPFHRDSAFTPFDGIARHIGVYVYRRRFLLEFLEWPQSELEKREQLEQLRIIEAGHAIRVIDSDRLSPGVDIAEDIESVEKLLNREDKW